MSDKVTLTIDGVEVTVPSGTLVIRAAEQIGVEIPRFCDHPLLEPVGACRQCLVEIPDAGNGRGFPKPQASCTIPVAEGMVVHTQATSPVADKAQQGIMEFLLINHPLDCPVCDKGGECPLQNQAMSAGRAESRFAASGGVKREFEKPINLSPQVLLDRERCIVCQRCTRFSDEIAGDPFIALVERGAQQQIGIAEDAPFLSYFSGNTIQICPVGALTSEQYRFRSRPFDLVSTPSIAEHDACGAAIRVDHRRGKVMRRLAGDDPEVNEEWISDKDRFAFRYAWAADRITTPLVRGEDGELRVASWPEAFAVAARGLTEAGATGVLPGGRVTIEDAYAYSKFARAALGTNDIDFRARPYDAGEADFLAGVAGSGLGVTYHQLETAPAVVLVAFEPEDEAGSLWLRLHKSVRAGGTEVIAVAPFRSRGNDKLAARLVAAAPGAEAAALASLEVPAGAVVLVGERASAETLSAAAALAERAGGAIAWVPRRAGDRGAVEAGLLPNLLPFGRRVDVAESRVDLAAAWGADLPATAGREADAIVAAATTGDLGGLVIGGVDPYDTADPAAFLAALDAAKFVVSLEIRESAVTERADVVFPVAAAVEKAGTYLNWEGRYRAFGQVLDVADTVSDLRVLAGIAHELGRPLGFKTVAEVQHEINELGAFDGPRPTTGSGGDPTPPPSLASGQYRLATHKLMLDNGSLQDGDDALAATARPAVVKVPPTSGIADGATVTLTGDRGSVSLPAEVAPDLIDDVVWVPANSFGRGVLADLASPGSPVTVAVGGGA